MQEQYSTRQVAHILGIKTSLLSRALWDGTAIAPQKSPAGNFIWTIAHIEAAAWAMGRFSEFKRWELRQEGDKA